jgi:hypothetical protein
MRKVLLDGRLHAPSTSENEKPPLRQAADPAVRPAAQNLRRTGRKIKQKHGIPQ